MREFATQAEGSLEATETDHLKVQSSASNEAMRPGQVATLVLDIELKPKMHVYSPDVGGGYIGVEWRIAAPEGTQVFAPDFPEAKEMHLEAVDETLPVYENSFRIVRDLRILGGLNLPKALHGKDELVVEGTFKYQACDDFKCHYPVTVPLRWSLKLLPHDRTRVPEAMRRRESGNGR